MHENKMEPDLYTLFHPPLVIQISAAADGRTSAAPPHPLRFLLDMGASTSFFDPSVVAKLGWKVRKDAVECTVWLAGGKPSLVVRDVTGGSFRVRNANFMVDGVVMALNGTYDGILGLNFCKRYGLLEQSPLLHRLLDSSGKVPMVNDVKPLVLRSTKLSAITPPNSVSLGAAETASYADIIAQLKSEFAEVFCDKLGDVADFPSVTKTKSGVRFEIILKPNATPAHAAPYRVPETLLPRFREMIAEHLNAGRLRYSSSPWVSPAFLVKKPNGQHRLVCDFRALNNQTVPDMYPMGNIQDILHRATRRGNLFAKLDSITMPLGLLEWVVMPQGIRNAPAAQQHCINKALQGLAGERCKAYVDDIIIWGKDAKDLYQNCAVWLRLLLEDVGLGLGDQALQLVNDNAGAIALSKNPVNHEKSKHIDMRHHFIREKVEDKTVSLAHVPSAENIADLLIKALPTELFTKLCHLLGMKRLDQGGVLE
ncbi:hypothetical protein J005_03127 [Cryptococcus neoformans]|nr:hypothetical protein J005_03127 [Cryptococcus neoformans var. grubii]